MSGIGIGISPVFGGGGFSPFAVGRPIVLLDAARGITLNGADVSGWADQSGNGNDATQATEPNQPLWNASSANFNGQSSLTFDGVSESITMASGNIGTQPDTIFTVYNRGAASGRVFDTSPARQIYFGGPGMVMFADNSGNIHTDDGNTHIAALFFNGALSNSWEDGVATAPSINPGTADVGAFSIGSDFGGGFSFYAGEIAYLLVYDFELSDAARNYVGSGLASRFGTTNGWA